MLKTDKNSVKMGCDTATDWHTAKHRMLENLGKFHNIVLAMNCILRKVASWIPATLLKTHSIAHNFLWTFEILWRATLANKSDQIQKQW